MISKIVYNGKEALELLDKKGKDFFDVLLIDYMMPEMNGDELKKNQEKGKKSFLDD